MIKKFAILKFKVTVFLNIPDHDNIYYQILNDKTIGEPSSQGPMLPSRHVFNVESTLKFQRSMFESAKIFLPVQHWFNGFNMTQM